MGMFWRQRGRQRLRPVAREGGRGLVRGRKRITWVKGGKVLMGVVLVLAGGWGVSRMKVKESRCVSQYGVCPREVQEYTRGFEGRSWIWILSKGGELIRGRFPWLRQVVVRPTGLANWKLLVVVPKAVVALEVDEPGFEEVVLVDRNGQVVGLVRDTYLPKIRVLGLGWGSDLRVGAGLAKGVSIMEELMDQGYVYRRAEMNGEQLEVWLDRDLRVIFSLKGKREADELVTALHLVLASSTIDRQQLSEIDLRFDRPVVK